MKGLELAKAYFKAYGEEMLSQFPELRDRIAVGLAGGGSECYGFDDDLSRDHDFEPGFCLFLPSEKVVDRRSAFLLERAYAKLPREFLGYTRSPLSPVGGNRHGVIRIEDFFSEKLGSPTGELSLEGWFSLPEYALLEATNGEVFSDPYGEFTAIRKRVAYFPEDVRRKKLAGHLLLMGQSGQYNFSRCLCRGEEAAAQLALFEFVKSALNCIYLLNRRYMPYYKWSFAGLRSLPLLSFLEKDLTILITRGNEASEGKEKKERIEGICAALGEALFRQGLIPSVKKEAEAMAYAVNDGIGDPSVRNLHVLYGV